MAVDFDELHFSDVGENRKDAFYRWALSYDFSNTPWSSFTDSYEDVKYLRFRWNQWAEKGFEVAVIAEPDKGIYRVCNVTPTRIPKFTPTEYNACLAMFIDNVLDRYNAEEGNHLLINLEKFGGKMTYSHGGDIEDNWTHQDDLNMLDAMMRELGYGRLELMVDVYNRHLHEIMSMESFSHIVDQIVDIITRQLLRPGNCDLVMATQCFVATCMKKQVPDSTRFDVFLSDGFQTQLSTLLNLDYPALAAAIQVGSVHVDLEALFAEPKKEG